MIFNLKRILTLILTVVLVCTTLLPYFYNLDSGGGGSNRGSILVQAEETQSDQPSKSTQDKSTNQNSQSTPDKSSNQNSQSTPDKSIIQNNQSTPDKSSDHNTQSTQDNTTSQTSSTASETTNQTNQNSGKDSNQNPAAIPNTTSDKDPTKRTNTAASNNQQSDKREDQASNNQQSDKREDQNSNNSQSDKRDDQDSNNQNSDKKSDQDSDKENQNHSKNSADNSAEENLTAQDALDQARKQGINLLGMKEGQIITFKAMAGTTEKKVTVKKGAHYEYSAYGLGSYETYKYQVTFGNVSATAYCIQPAKSSPDSGTYTITKLSDSKNLAKVCYYGTKAAGDDGFFSEKHTGYPEGKRFILVHLAASYANGGSAAFSGANSTARNLAMELYNWCVSQPDIPDVDMAFSDDDVTAYVEDGRQRTKEIKFKADKLQTITFRLPDGVKLHNVTSGKTSSAGANVEISGGTSFYLSAPLSQTADVSGSWTTTMKGSITKDYSAYKITTGGGEQDLALVFGEGVDDEKYIDFHVSWIRLGELTIYKKGEDLTSATVNGNGVTFHYESAEQKNAVYNLYAAEDIKDGSGKVIYKKGELAAGSLKTDARGSVTVKNLYAGTYTITEMNAPSGFYNSGQSQTVTVKYSSDNQYSKTFVNARQKAQVSVIKQDGETHNPLSGAVFGLYAGNDIKNKAGQTVVSRESLIGKAVTSADGKALFTADLPLGYSYYVKELQAPAGYVRNTTDIFSFLFAYTNDRQEKQTFTHTFADQEVKANIKLIKEDRETGSSPQGDAILSGAVYGLYARQAILHPDGKTGTMYRAGEKVANLVTDAEGKAEIKGLYLGKYYIKEISPSTGYLLDDQEYEIAADYEGDTKPVVVKNVNVTEQVIRQPFQLIKAANNGKTDADLLQGAGFKAYLLRTLKKASDGTYEYENANPVSLTESGQEEMFTDAHGHAVSAPLPYGRYLVVESTTPHNYSPVDPFIVNIEENAPQTPQVWRVMLDEEFKAKLKIIKKDDESKRSILLANTEFKLYDMENHSYIEQVTTYPRVTVHQSYFTNEEGYLILPESLSPGHYRIEEVSAPEGYTINREAVEIHVDTDVMHQIDPVSQDVLIEVIYENHPVKGQLIINKSGEEAVSFDGSSFIYKEKKLEGAVFEVYAAEDIYTPDHQLDSEGNRLVQIPADRLVMTITTGPDGRAVAADLPLGRYYVKEKTAPEGFVLSEESTEAEFTYLDQNTPVIYEELSCKNERQKLELAVIKKDSLTKSSLAGAQFAIFNREDILCSKGDAITIKENSNKEDAGSDRKDYNKEVIVTADTKLATFTSDSEGRALCGLDLPLGSYYVKEISAPPGYISSDKVLDFDASWQGQNVETVALEVEMENQPTEAEFTKTDITSGRELSGAKLTVLDADGQELESWISDKEKPHVIHGLEAGKTYILREEFAPYGYLKAEDVEFTLNETGELQKVEMKDDVPTGIIILTKKGEMLTRITLLKRIKGYVEHFFEYVSGTLADVSFEIYASEDIKAADGVSPDYYKKDQLVSTMTTDASGIARVTDLPAGRYYIKETRTAAGYVLADKALEVDLSYRNQDTPVIISSQDWNNDRQKVSVYLTKEEKGSRTPLSGAIFGLFAGENIYSVDGNMLLEKDEIIELDRTGQDGRLTFTADLPVNASYYVMELHAPDGYVLTSEKEEFRTDYKDSGLEMQEIRLTFEDQPTTTEISKTDLTGSRELPGAHLKIIDQEGKTIDSWVSTDKPHVIKKLIADRSYRLIETKPADGYTTAETIRFTVQNTADIQKINMKDDVTKVQISKQDIAGKELPGARLTIFDDSGKKVESWTSTAKPHYIEMLPIGRYILREETAPKGYLVAKEVAFDIKDTARVQKVKMTDKPVQPARKTSPARTGDQIPVGIWVMLLLAAAAGIGAITYRIVTLNKEKG
ncbi:MAG: peptidase [Eubacterium sp.]|nr:peptidase [Eubacterium sp.]